MCFRTFKALDNEICCSHLGVTSLSFNLFYYVSNSTVDLWWSYQYGRHYFASFMHNGTDALSSLVFRSVKQPFGLGAIPNRFWIKSCDNFLEENIPNQQRSPSATIKRTKCQDEVHIQNQVEPEEIKLFQIKIKNPWFCDIFWRMITLFFKT
jgi:hypothetical protein